MVPSDQSAEGETTGGTMKGSDEKKSDNKERGECGRAIEEGKSIGEVKGKIREVGSKDTNIKAKKKVKCFPRKLSRTSTSIRVAPSVPRRRETFLRWYGWGYKDSGFELDNGRVFFAGDRYPICGNELPFLLPYIKEKYDLSPTGTIKPGIVPEPREEEYPASRFSREDIEAIEELGVEVSTEGIVRLMRSRGQSIDDVIILRSKKIVRIPDAVAWPTCHEEVVELVKLAEERNFAIIPFGGGTSVARALECPPKERRPILSLDTNSMNEILWVDKENLIVCSESGIIGQDLERELGKLGFTTGHDPDSLEFSTLGGWVSTRASGMKKNTYGNIEDLLVHARLVTPKGTLSKGSTAPRMSCGPDFNHIILGSEGSFGVITEVALKIRPLPELQHYGSLMFPDFETGIKFLREVALRRWQPASIRLLDEEQFQMGWALRPKNSALRDFFDGLKFAYLEKIKKFDLKKMCLITLVYEGFKNEVLDHEKRLNKLALLMEGVPAGAATGKRGYMMTFVIAYIRDIGVEFNVIADSLESAISWDNVYAASLAIRSVVSAEGIKMGALRSLAMMRVAQTYDSGACLYVYVSFRPPIGADVAKMANHLLTTISDVIMAHGGSVSHHHGVGKLKKRWYEKAVSPTGVLILKGAKARLDPENIFASNNFIDDYSDADIESLKSKL